MPNEIPDIVKALESKVDAWKYLGEILLIIPKNAYFNEMYFLKRRLLWSMDEKSIFIGVTNIVSENQMNRDMKKLYQKLKGMECELKREGFLGRRMYFKHSSSLLDIKNRISGLKLDDKLIRKLNEDKYLFDLLAKVKPEKLALALSISPNTPIQTAEDYYRTVLSYYKNPLKISWEVSLAKVIERGLGFRKTITGIFDIIDYLSKILKEITAPR